MWLRYMSLVALVLAPVVTYPAAPGTSGGSAFTRWVLRLVIWAGAAASLWWVIAPWTREMLAVGHTSDRFGAPVPLALALSVGLVSVRLWALRRPR